MATLHEHYARFEKEWAEANHRKQERMIFEKAVTLNDDTTASLLIVGGTMANFLPQVKSLQRKQTEVENDIEFAPVYKFFSLLFDHEDFANWLIEESFGTLTQTEME